MKKHMAKADAGPPGGINDFNIDSQTFVRLAPGVAPGGRSAHAGDDRLSAAVSRRRQASGPAHSARRAEHQPIHVKNHRRPRTRSFRTEDLRRAVAIAGMDRKLFRELIMSSLARYPVASRIRSGLHNKIAIWPGPVGKTLALFRCRLDRRSA